MAGALAERDLADKLGRAGFTRIEVVDRRAFGIEDCALYPLFETELIELMRRLIPPERHADVATSIVVRAIKPGRGGSGSRDAGRPGPAG